MEELVHKIKDAPPLRPMDDDDDLEEEENLAEEPVKLPFNTPVKP